MALKTKGKPAKLHPKAGPKKRRAKSEEAAIRAAVEEHGKRGVRAVRKSSKVNTFRYKDPAEERAKRKKLDAYLREMERVFGLREPRHEHEFLMFYDVLKEDERPFAAKLFQMECDHPQSEVIAQKGAWSSGEPIRYLACTRCGIVRREGTTTFMRVEEWTNYCPDGYDMFDWMDLLTKDKSLWRFIYDEVIAEMTANALTEEAT